MTAISTPIITGMAQYLIWDFDGTLAERDGMRSGTLVEVAVQAGVHTTREAVRPFLQSGFPWHSPELVRPSGEPADQWWARLEPVFCRAFVDGVGLPRSQAQALARCVRDVYTDARRWRVFPDVAPCLKALSAAGWEHLILSNHVPELERLVGALDLGGCFKAIFSSANTGVEKPHPRAFEMVQEIVGDGGDLWMIGDSWHADICGAAEAGIKAILVRKSHAQVKRCCIDLASLPALVHRG